jgi:cytosine/adenosine deaminase-related metal-dependent hydrolase
MRRHAWRCTALAAVLAGSPVLAAGVQPADLLIRNVTVVDVEQDKPALLLNRDIVVRDGRIADVRPHSDAKVAARRVITGPFIALPGFIDTHTHLWQHVAKSVAPSSKLQEWVTKVYAATTLLSPREVWDGVGAAASEALLSGITTVVDFASINTAGDNLVGVVGALREREIDGAVVFFSEQAFLNAREKEALIRRLNGYGAKRIEVWMGYGPPSFCDVPAVYDGIAMARRLGLRMTEHLMENVDEQRAFQERVRKYLREKPALSPEDQRQLAAVAEAPELPKSDAYVRLQRLALQVLAGEPLDEAQRKLLEPLAKYTLPSPVPLLDYLGGIPDGFVSIHSVWQTPADLDLYKARHVSIAYNPESNFYLSSGAAPVEWWGQRNLNVSLGTDGAASNDRIDMFAAMRAPINAQKQELQNAVRAGDAIDSWKALKMATINGAKAIGRESSTGSIVTGKEADILLLSPERLGLSPLVLADPARVAALLVYSAGTRDIDTVVSNGHLMVEKGKLGRGLDEGEEARKLSEIVHHLQRRIDQGVEWKEEWDFQAGTPLGSDYLAASKKDLVRLYVKNTGDAKVTVNVRFSGTVPGDTVGALLDEATAKRFPASTPARFWQRSYDLPPHTFIDIRKAAGSSTWHMGGDLREGVETEEQVSVSVSPP